MVGSDLSKGVSSSAVDIRVRDSVAGVFLRLSKGVVDGEWEAVKEKNQLTWNEHGETVPVGRNRQW